MHTLPEIYTNTIDYTEAARAVELEYFQASQEFYNNPSAINWRRLETAMYNHQHIRCNARDSNGHKAIKMKVA